MDLSLQIAIFAFIAIVAGDEIFRPIVTTREGAVEGLVEKARGNSRDFYAFRGIPYAKIVERFQAPAPADKWEGTKDASNYGPVCPQFDCYSMAFKGEEECLSANVFTPVLPMPGNSTKLLPVLVYLHLGNHFFGSGQLYEPQYLMEEDMVVVTINSRLGLFGYLNLGDENAPGNMGLRDQSAALIWIKDNIHLFSGDFSRVTLMGTGSGGTDIFIHMFNKGSQGLFHRAVISSASLNSCSFTRDPGLQARKLGEQVGCPTNSSAGLVNCLKGMKPLEILEKMKSPKDFDFEKMDYKEMEDFTVFGPSVEVELKGDKYERVLKDHPYKLLETPEANLINKVPLIIGSNEMDGLDPFTGMFLNDSNKFSTLTQNWTQGFPYFLDFAKSPEPEKTAKKVWDFYSKNGSIDGDAIIKMANDRNFELFVKIATEGLRNLMPIYRYKFTHEPSFRVVDSMQFQNMPKGPGNMDELQYFFNMSISFQTPIINQDTTPSTEYILSKGMVSMLTSFSAHGKPNMPWGQKWEEDSSENEIKPKKFYAIDMISKMTEEPKEIRQGANFWYDLQNSDLKYEMDTIPPKF